MKTIFMADLSPELLALGFIWYVAFLFSTTCHEAAHALAAKIGGDDTAFAGGQVSLNPVPHIQREPWGMVVIPILSLIINGSLIGWASACMTLTWTVWPTMLCCRICFRISRMLVTRILALYFNRPKVT